MEKKKKIIIAVIAVVLVIAIIVAICIGVNNTVRTNAVNEFEAVYEKTSNKYTELATKVSAYSAILDSSIATSYSEAGNAIADMGVNFSQKVNEMKTDEIKELTQKCNETYSALEELETSFLNVENALQQ